MLEPDVAAIGVAEHLKHQANDEAGREGVFVDVVPMALGVDIRGPVVWVDTFRVEEAFAEDELGGPIVSVGV